jgi:hypothetical protein
MGIDIFLYASFIAETSYPSYCSQLSDNQASAMLVAEKHSTCTANQIMS